MGGGGGGGWGLCGLGVVRMHNVEYYADVDVYH